LRGDRLLDQGPVEPEELGPIREIGGDQGFDDPAGGDSAAGDQNLAGFGDRIRGGVGADLRSLRGLTRAGRWDE
jgi:hypothetical protein